MSKRKRCGDDDDDHDDNAPQEPKKDFRRLRQIVRTFEDSSEQLAKAFKAAKGGERMKLGRRKKTAVAEKNGKESERIDAEVAALKTLDSLTIAQHFLAKSLMKIKAVVTSPDLPSEIRIPKAIPTDAPALNVNARLCNSAGVKAVFPGLYANVKREFGIVDKVEVPVKKKRLRAKDYDNTEASETGVAKKAEKEDAEDQDDMAENDELSDGEENDHRRRLAASGGQGSDEYDLGETSDIEELERMLENEGIFRKGSKKSQSNNRTRDLSLPDDELEPEPPVQKPAKTAATTKKFSFLPSLTMGGYISGSGSDLDSDMDIAPVKKNRRGQRARQAIWEKKYGAGAKHVKLKAAADARTGWDAQRGAVEQKPHRFANAANAAPLGPRKGEKKEPKKRDDSGPLHPSWLAAKAAKEKKAIPVVFSGKKISFD